MRIGVHQPGAEVQRISPADLTVLATDVGPVAMNVGAGVRLAPDGLDPLPCALLAARIGRVPRMRQRLTTVPRGLGRPVWVQDPSFDGSRHVTVQGCPAPGDLGALLDLATSLVTHPLPRSRPLWRAVVVTGLPDGGAALVIVLHHVMADGIGGLALLAALADPAGADTRGADTRGADIDFDSGTDLRGRRRRVLPSTSLLAADRFAEACRTLRAVPRAVGQLAAARNELGAAPRAPRCSLNAPTGPRRRVATVDIELAAVRAAARRRGATVNDLLLVATTAALESVLADRGEHPPALVVSVPISARTADADGVLGNQVGVMPVTVPLAGSLTERLVRVAGITAAQRGRTRGASAALVGPAFRVLAAVGVFGWFVDRQRLVNTFLTNLRGPTEPLTLAGARIESITPITTTAGNVTVAFAALSYGGNLTLTVIVDPDRFPELDALTDALDAQLLALVTQSSG